MTWRSPVARFEKCLVQELRVLGFVLLCFMAIVDSIGLTSDNILVILLHGSPFNAHTVPLLCDGYVFTKVTTLKASSLLILSIALERFYATYYPFPYKENVSLKILSKVGTFCIVIAVLSGGLVSATQGHTEIEKCFAVRESVNKLFALAVVIQSIVFFLLIPSVGTSVLNILIVVKLRLRNKNQRFSSPLNVFSPQAISQPSNRRDSISNVKLQLSFRSISYSLEHIIYCFLDISS